MGVNARLTCIGRDGTARAEVNSEIGRRLRQSYDFIEARGLAVQFSPWDER